MNAEAQAVASKTEEAAETMAALKAERNEAIKSLAKKARAAGLAAGRAAAQGSAHEARASDMRKEIQRFAQEDGWRHARPWQR